MPEVTSCPQCQRKLRVPDELLGKKVKCPGCSLTFTATADSPVPPQLPPGIIGTEPSRRAMPAPPPMRMPRQNEEIVEDDGPDDFEERRPKRGGARQAWLSVRLGIVLVLIAILGLIITAAIQFIGQTILLSSAGDRIDPNTGLPDTSGLFLLGICVLILQLICRSIQVTGYWFFMRVPERSGARPLASICFGTGAASTALDLLISILAWILMGRLPNMIGGQNPFAQFPQNLALAWSLGIAFLISLIVRLIEYFCSLYFYKTVADHLRSSGVGTSITYQVVFNIITILMFIGLFVVLFLVAAAVAGGGVVVSRSNGQTLTFLYIGCGCLTGLMALGCAIWYVITQFLMLGVVNGTINRR